MPCNAIRLQPQVVEEPQERQARATNRRLRPLGRGQAAFLSRSALVIERGAWKDDLMEPPVSIPLEVRRTIPRLECAVELHRDRGAHVQILTPLPGEEIREAAFTGALTAAKVDPGRSLEGLRGIALDALRRLLELGGQIGLIACDDGEARWRSRIELVLTRAGQPVQEPGLRVPGGTRSRSLNELGGVLPGQCHQLTIERTQPRRGPRRDGIPRQVLGHGDMEVRTPESERTHRRAARMSRVAHPRPRFGR